MKIRSVVKRPRRRGFVVATSRGELFFPYGRARPVPSAADPVVEVFVDPELGGEGFTYRLASGDEGSIHVDHVLEHNEDPETLRELLLHRLTVEAQKRVVRSPLSRREIIRRLGTSATQFYRLLDTTNRRKSVDRMLALLSVLEADVDLVVRDRRVLGRARALR